MNIKHLYLMPASVFWMNAKIVKSLDTSGGISKTKREIPLHHLFLVKLNFIYGKF